MFYLIFTFGTSNQNFFITAIVLSCVNGWFVIMVIYLTLYVICLILWIGEFLVRLVTCKLNRQHIANFENRHYIIWASPSRAPISTENAKPYKRNVYAQTNCIICLSDFQENQLICQLACHETHIFHKTCLDEWLKHSEQCPMCRITVNIVK